MAEPSILTSRAARVTWVMAATFAANGVLLPFLPRWLEFERGLAGAEIGAILSLAQIGRILTGPIIADWADHAKDRRMPIRVVAAAAAVAFGLFFTLGQNFWTLFVLGFFALSLMYALMPFIEAAMLRACENGRMSYGLARGLGSLAFILATIGGGFVVARFGPAAVAVWITTALAVTAFSAFVGLQHDPPQHVQSGVPHARASWGELLSSRRYLIVIISCGLIQAAHGFYYGFSTLVWRGQDLSPEHIGFLWAFGVAIEVALLWSLPRIEPRLSPEILILIGGAGAVLRWSIMGFAPTGFVLWPIQGLHAVTFAATHVGAMRLIYREAPESAAGRAQTLYAALASGLFMGLSSLASGWLYDHVNAQGYWAMAGLALMGLLVALPLMGAQRRVKR